MKATITDRKQKFSASHRKEKAGLHKSYSMLIQDRITPEEAHAVAELRIYHPGGTAYACLWTHAPATDAHPEGVYIQGSGKAGGYGYDKQSAAAEAAITAAGIDLSQSIAGVGASAIREALRAIADALGYPEAMLFETHP